MVDKKLHPVKGYKQLDTAWSWVGKLGAIKTMLITVLGGGLVTYLVSLFQRFPRWLILSLVFAMSSILVFSVLIAVPIVVDWAKDKLKEIAVLDPISKRVASLEAQVGPRHLTPEQRQLISSKLTESGASPGKARVIWVSRDQDAAAYAQEFVDLLTEAKWNVWGPDEKHESDPSIRGYEIGLTVLTSGGIISSVQDTTQMLVNAMAEAGLELHYYFGYGLHQGSCELIIGHRGKQMPD